MPIREHPALTERAWQAVLIHSGSFEGEMVGQAQNALGRSRDRLVFPKCVQAMHVYHKHRVVVAPVCLILVRNASQSERTQVLPPPST
jgi:hypothetical protein